MSSFATPAEMVAFAGLNLDAERMQALLDHASAVIRRVTGQHLSEVAGDAVEYGPTELEVLFLPERPVTAVTQLLVDGEASTAFDWTRWGTVNNVPIGGWAYGAVVTYDHGYAGDSDEIAAIKTVCLGAATRAYTMNERSASEGMGPVMESAGYAPEVFLTPTERGLLWDLGGVVVG